MNHAISKRIRREHIFAFLSHQVPIMHTKKDLNRICRHPFLSLSFCLLLSLVLLTFTRMLLLVFNPDLFNDHSTPGFVIIMFRGLLFDVSALMFINALFIVFMLSRAFLRMPILALKLGFVIFYVIPNSIAVMLNLGDVIYYRFTFKRTTADILDYIGHAGEMNMLLPQFLNDFWFIFLIGAVCIALFILIGWRLQYFHYQPRKSPREILLQLPIAMLLIFFTLIGMRGGFSLKPIGIAQAVNYMPAHTSALVLNTPFTVIRTFWKTALKEVKYFDNESVMKTYFNAVYKPPDKSDAPFELQTENPNFVIILLESFSREHIGFYNKGLSGNNYKGFTPFLDSLMEHSIVFDGFANGKRSIEAIPAIISGLPSLMNNDFISSIYANNNVYSLAKILERRNYKTQFFHGGSNGTMGFDTYARAVGFQNYYGREEFDDDTYYDGRWGIFDEEFLQFAATRQSATQQPFFSFIFTLSSHHPYTVPLRYKGKLPEGPLPIHQTIAYTDNALKQYFKTVSKQPWFRNTVFIITSDHTSEAWTQYFKNATGMYSIPVIFYLPDTNLHEVSNKIVQHTDLLPTILHLLDHQDSIVAFGYSAFDENKPRFNITFRNGIYQLYCNGYVIHFDGLKALDLYNIEKDSLCQLNILNDRDLLADSMVNFIKSFAQQYNSRMIHNELVRANN